MILGRRLAKKELTGEMRAELRAEEVQPEYARVGWNSLQYAFTPNEWKRRKDENSEGGECRGNDVGRLPDERMATRSPSSGGRRRKHVDWMKK